MTISLKIFELKGINKDSFIDIFGSYNEVVDNIPELNAELRASTNNFSILDDNIVSFEYQHDFKQLYELRGKRYTRPRSFKADFWVLFRNGKHYIFVSGDKDAISFVVPEFITIIADKKFNEVTINKIKITSEALISISGEDAVTINESWFNNLDVKS